MGYDRRGNLAVAGVVLWLLAGAGASRALGQGPVVEAITKPSKDVTLSFVQPGRIKTVLVKLGDTVKAGQPLAQLDDAAERAQLAQLKAQADDVVRVRAAEAQLAQKKLDLQKYERAAKNKAATDLEVEHAKLEVLIAELSLALAEFQRAQDGRKYAEVNLRVSRMRMISPVAGRVEQVHIEVGESVNAMDEVIRVVNVNPLWIDAPVPLAHAGSLKVGQTLDVTFLGGATDGGKIVNIATVADAASSTLAVRLEVPNPLARPAGERVKISLPAPVKAAKRAQLAPAIAAGGEKEKIAPQH